MADHQIPENLKYTVEHEWILLEDNILTIGITDFAQSSLGDIVFIELPDADTAINKGESFGVVESIKSVSDLYSPATGIIIDSNTDLTDSPESCNSSPYSSWMIKIKLDELSKLDSWLTPADYKEHCQKN